MNILHCYLPNSPILFKVFIVFKVFVFKVQNVQKQEGRIKKERGKRKSTDLHTEVVILCDFGSPYETCTFTVKNRLVAGVLCFDGDASVNSDFDVIGPSIGPCPDPNHAAGVDRVYGPH